MGIDAERRAHCVCRLGTLFMKLAMGSRTGTGVWLLQRATAVVLAIALPILILNFVAAWPLDFHAWRAWLAPLWMRVVLLLTGMALALHAWVGMRDIFMDYLHAIAIRLSMLLVVIAVLAGSVVWLAAILFGTSGWSGQ